MKIKKLLTSLFMSILSVAYFAEQSAGQCSLTLVPKLAETAANVRGVSASAMNRRTKRTYLSVSRAGSPHFTRLPEGDYQITGKKAGYKRSKGDIKLECSGSSGRLYIVSMSLWKGSSRLIVNNGDLAELYPRPSRDVYFTSTTDPGTPPPDYRAPAPQRSGSRTVPRQISGGVLNGKANSLPKPVYPPAARAVRASGAVDVEVLIDEAGNVISATAVSGHPLLRAAAVNAARGAKFSPTQLSGVPVKVSGIIVYNFVP
jgi:TonB family protein